MTKARYMLLAVALIAGLFALGALQYDQVKELLSMAAAVIL